MAALSQWLRERVPISGDQLRQLADEPVPVHLKLWWYCLGGTPAYLFLIQIFTGLLLAFYYEPTPSDAYDSVAYITHEAAYGWYIRGMHKWGATLMIAAVILHQLRVYFTGAYRKPREINWMIGMFLLLCTLGVGFTGYSLVYEQLSFWGATVAANITDSVPVVGGFFKRMLLGGETYNERTLSRLFILHAAVLPITMILLLIVHITLIRLQGVTEFEVSRSEKEERRGGRRLRDHFNFFPDHILTELTIGLVLMVILSALATIVPATMGPPADPLTTPELIKPEWYFYVSFRWLKLFSGTVAILSMGFILFIMFIWPFIDAQVRRWWPASEFSVWLGIVAVTAIIGLTVWEAAVEH